MYQTSSKSQGFTIIELMITLAVAAILLSLAAPSFTDIIKNNRLVTQVNLIAAGLNFARSEAIKRSVSVTLCKSDDQATCNGNWQDGWLLFEDSDGNGTVDAGDTIIRVGAGTNTAATGITLVFPNKNRITYNPDGFAVGFNSTFKFCDDRGSAFGKGLVVSNTGRVRTAQPADIASCL